MAHVSLGGALYYLLFKDDFSGYRYIFCIAEKTDTLRYFQDVYHDIFRDTGNHLQILRTDGGGKFTSKRFEAYLSQQGVRHEVTAPYSPKQNGFCERDNMTIMEGVRSLLHTSGFPLTFWAEACHTMVYTLNRTGSRLIPGQTPYTLWYGVKPSLEHLRVFGCQVYAYIEKAQRTKLDPKSHLCYFLGYCENTKGYRIWNPVTSKVLICREVTFNEQLLYKHTEESSPSSSSSDTSPTVTLSFLDHTDPADATSPLASSSCSSASTPVPDTTLASQVTSSPSPSVFSRSEFQHANIISPQTLHAHPNFHNETPVKLRSLAHLTNPPVSNLPLQLPPTASSPPNTQAHLIHTLPTSSSVDVSAPFTSAAFPPSHTNIADFLPDDPFTYLEALHSPEAAQWVQAMTEEINSLRESKTWELVRLPDGRQAIECKWVFKTKYLPNGNIDKFKARLVAKGYTQKVGIDYSETFSPVVKFETVRIVMAISAADDLEIIQFDIKTAFLNGDIAELLYMAQPEGFVDSAHPDYVCLLRKALYGLKQASRNWNHKFHQFFLQFGFQVSDADPCAYYSSQGGQTIILLIYVDDGLICFSRGTNVDHILDTMDQAFSNTRGPAGCYVGLRITRRRNTHEIFLD